jgi:serine/threonine protein phosphatase PrpC
MNVWKSFGASVIGPGHVANGIPNQDAWAAFHHEWGDGIAVSDGLGSKPLSDFGSRAACLAVARAIQSCSRMPEIDLTVLADRIMSGWVSLIAPLSPRDCAATCLFGFRMNDRGVLIGTLGDGLAAVLKTDGSVVSLSDDKSEGFSNITEVLSPEVGFKEWRWLSMPEEECQSILLCSDGVCDDLTDHDGFIREFFAAHKELSSLSASRRTREMLAKWPTLRHSDDKTIACLLREEVEYE